MPKDRVRDRTVTNPCPGCETAIVPTEPVCGRCWNSLPVQLQQAVAASWPTDDAAVRRAALWIHDKTAHASMLRANEAARSALRREGSA